MKNHVTEGLLKTVFPVQFVTIKVFLGPRENAELVPKFHVALHASHAALPMVTLKISL
jgi:hypothetical protein